MNFVTVEQLRSTLRDLHKHGMTPLKLQDLCGMKYGRDWWPIYLTFKYLLEH